MAVTGSDSHAAVESPDRRALAKQISRIEADPASYQYSGPGPAIVVGVTGPPGVGKSTLVSSLIDYWRQQGSTVAVLAVDPSSPITGGALLGDRIRMQSHVDDAGVFIRSMSARGHLGGLSSAAPAVIDLLGQTGFDYVLVETVGVGQSEVEVMGVVDVVVLVVAPGWGDQIQADKAGIGEVADVYVVNKADRAGAEEVKRVLLDATSDRQLPILLTTASDGDGTAELAATIAQLASS